MPKATIKMQQTQPLVKQPGATVTQSSVQPVPTLTTTSLAGVPQEAAADGLVTVLSIIALIASAAALGLVYLVFSASALS